MKHEPIKAWGIGDAIEIRECHRDHDTEVVFDHWRPATVIAINPLCVQFSNHSRLALHDGIKRRRPS